MARHTGLSGPDRRRFVPALPGLDVLSGYGRGWLRGDLTAGMTVAAYLVPQVMAYATVAGLPPVTGLWAMLPAIPASALFSSSRLLSVGPESTTALMAATVVGPLASGDAVRYAELAAALAVVVGALCLVAWAGRLGFVADLLSKPVLIGYLAGVALLMMVDQLTDLTGVRVEGSRFLPRLWSFVRHLPDANAATVLCGATALFLLLAVAHRSPRVPGPLLTVLVGTAAVAAFGLERHGISTVGTVPGGLPHLSEPDLGELHRLVLPAAGVLLVGYTDMVLTARAFAAGADGDRPVAGQELFALGAANLGAGFLSGFPVSSSASRTALARSAGGRTQLYALVAGGWVLAVLLFLDLLLTDLPVAVLGAMVVFAAMRLIDLLGFRRLASFRHRELLLAIGCLVGVLVLDILYGVLVAVGLSVAELLSRVARPHDAVQGLVPGLAGMHDVDDYARARAIPGLVVYRYDSPLFFANAEDFRSRALAAVADETAPVRWFVLNVESNVEVDITTLDAVEDLRRELTGRGVVFAMARVKQDLLDDLDAYGLTESIGPKRIFPTLPTVLEAYRTWRATHDGGADTA